jgi:hypothetical protein
MKPRKSDWPRCRGSSNNFRKLREKLQLAHPQLLADGKAPSETSLEDHDEYQFWRNCSVSEGGLRAVVAVRTDWSSLGA